MSDIDKFSESVNDWEVCLNTHPDDIKSPNAYNVVSKVKPGQSYSIVLNDIFGITYPPWINEERWNYLNSHVVYKPSDIIVVTYPKCGTTWIEQVVLSLLSKADSNKLNPVHKNAYIPSETIFGKIWIEGSIDQDVSVASKVGGECHRISWEEFDSAPSPRVIKSHAPNHLLIGTNQQGVRGLPIGVKCIVVTRNPLDACVSAYYHAFNPYKSGWPFSAWASVWLAGKVPHGSWFDWVKGWRGEYESYPDQVCWIQYETVASDPHSEVRKIAAFLNLNIDDDLIERVVQVSSFDSMSNQASEKTGSKVGHLRKGIVGDWENHFTPQLLTDFHKRYDAELQDQNLDYSFGAHDPWPKLK